MSLSGHLRVECLEKEYGPIKALDSVTLDFDAGKIVALLGINGSGKTTLLRVLAGLEEPSRGEILLDGRRMRGSDLRKVSTMVFQKAVMFDMSVYDNVALGWGRSRGGCSGLWPRWGWRICGREGQGSYRGGSSKGSRWRGPSP
ncbi:MAG: ATP-binding cassette domain-containing protein [Candidatus Bathyarchaeia archaeon]